MNKNIFKNLIFFPPDKLNVDLPSELPEHLPALGDPASVQHPRLSGGDRPQAGLPEHQHHHSGQ